MAPLIGDQITPPIATLVMSLCVALPVIAMRSLNGAAVERPGRCVAFGSGLGVARVVYISPPGCRPRGIIAVAPCAMQSSAHSRLDVGPLALLPDGIPGEPNELVFRKISFPKCRASCGDSETIDIPRT